MLVRLLCLLGFLAAGTGRVFPASPGQDEGQQLWSFLRSHGYGVLQIDSLRYNSQYLDAVINGKHVLLAIDTGCDHTRLRRACAEDLGLEIHDTGKAEYGMGGRVKGTAGLARVASFKLGGYEINRTDLIGVMPAGEPAKNADGLLGYDFLKANAMILPVGAKFVFFKPGAAGPADITTYMEAMGFKPVPLTHEPVGLVASGHLNGSPLTAIVDCGASLSVFSINYLNGTAKAPVRYIGTMPMGLDGHREPTFLFTPTSLDFGALAFRPEELLSQFSPILVATKHQAFLGYDLMAAHDAIIDLGHDVLWLKPSG